MTTVSIIGTGAMAQAIAGIVTKGGNTAELLAHSEADKAVTGTVVVLAVPYPAVAEHHLRRDAVRRSRRPADHHRADRR